MAKNECQVPIGKILHASSGTTVTLQNRYSVGANLNVDYNMVALSTIFETSADNVQLKFEAGFDSLAYYLAPLLAIEHSCIGGIILNTRAFTAVWRRAPRPKPPIQNLH